MCRSGTWNLWETSRRSSESGRICHLAHDRRICVWRINGICTDFIWNRSRMVDYPVDFVIFVNGILLR